MLNLVPGCWGFFGFWRVCLMGIVGFLGFGFGYGIWDLDYGKNGRGGEEIGYI